MKIPEIIKITARKLRKNMTKAEVILWNFIKDESIWYKFLRQKPIYVYTENNWLDRFIIADFYCHDKKIVIEIDWSIHDVSEVLELDLHKEKLLKDLGIKVIRIKNEEIFSNINNVLEIINEEIK